MGVQKWANLTPFNFQVSVVAKQFRGRVSAPVTRGNESGKESL
jgi:hypothetical protein